MPKDADLKSKLSNGFDAIYKGMEITSGGQRIHIPELLIEISCLVPELIVSFRCSSLAEDIILMLVGDLYVKSLKERGNAPFKGFPEAKMTPSPHLISLM